ARRPGRRRGRGSRLRARWRPASGHPGHARGRGDRRLQELAPAPALFTHAAKCILFACADSAGGFMLRPRLAFLALAALATPLAADPSAPLRAPVAKKEPHKIEIHGDTLVDDYYWMRNKGTPEVESHLRAELAYSDAFMKPTAALQQKLYDEMLARIQQTDTNVPARDRGFFYYSRTEEGKQYPIHARRKGSLDAPEEVILDVNALAEGKKFMSIGDMAVSAAGNPLTYTADETGFRQYTLHVKDLRTGQL